MPQEQAEAFAAELRTISELELDFSHLATKDELKTAISELKTTVAEVKADVIKWVVGMSFAQVTIILAILKLH